MQVRVVHNRFPRIIASLPTIVRDGVVRGADRIRQAVEHGAPVRSGTLRRSIEVEGTERGARIVATAPHANYVEFGTRYMDAQPYMRPAADVDDVVPDVVAELRRL